MRAQHHASFHQIIFNYYVHLNNTRSISASEWRRYLPERPVKITLGEGQIICVSSPCGELLRTIDLRGVDEITICLENDHEQSLMSARTEKEYDLVRFYLILFRYLIIWMRLSLISRIIKAEVALSAEATGR